MTHLVLAAALTACAPRVAVSPAAAPPAGNLVLDGTPQVPPELVARMAPYRETRAARLADLSADGSTMLVLTRFAETWQVHRLDRPMGARTQLTFRAEPARGAELLPGSDGRLVFLSDEGGNEQHQVFLLDPRTGETRRVTGGSGQHGEPSWSPDGRRAVFTSTARNGKDFDSPEAPVAAFPAAAGRDRLYVATDREGEFVELYEVALPDGWAETGLDPAALAWRPLTRDIAWDVEDLDLSPDGATLAFTVNEGGASTLFLLDTATGGHQRVESLPQGVVQGLQFAEDAPVLGFTLSTATSMSDAWSLDLRSGEVVRWTESEMGGLDPAGFVTPELVAYPSFDGLEIPAWYYRPAGAGPHPVVIAIHGGPEGQSRPTFSHRVQFLVRELGIAVLEPNVRGSTGYGKSWLMLDNGTRREDSVQDIGALLDWIAAQAELDAGRVGVTGGSYGGYMVLASMVRYGDRIRAGVDAVGIANFVTFLENTQAYRQDLRRVEYGDERDPEMRAYLERISPVHDADRITGALFVAHGANDPRVPASEAEQIVAAVRSRGQEVWYMLATNEGHGFRQKENADTYALLQALFFERYLVGAREEAR